MKKFTQYFNKCALSEAVETSNPTKKRLSAVFDLVADDSRDFGIVSSFQSKATEEVNAQTHDELKSKVIDMGYGYIELCSSSKKEGNDVSEKSLMVPNITKTQIITLGRQFDQPLVMFKNSINFYYISTNETKGIGKVLMKFEKGEGQDNLELAKHKVTDFFSALESGESGAKTGEETPPDRSKTQPKASATDYLPTNSGNAKVYAPTKGTQNKKPKIGKQAGDYHDPKYHALQSVWKTSSGIWGAKDRNGKFEYFDNIDSANKFAKRTSVKEPNTPVE